MNTSLYFTGNIAYWQQMVHSSKVTFIIGNKIPKKSYINRTSILSPNGIFSLSIPLEGGRGGYLPMSKSKISYDDAWIHRFKMTLISCYSKSPFFEFYRDALFEMMDRKYASLYELNQALFLWIYKITDSKFEYQFINIKQNHTTEFIPNKYKYIAGYPQVFRYKYPFQPDLSILDLIFNIGPKSREYLANIS